MKKPFNIALFLSCTLTGLLAGLGDGDDLIYKIVVYLVVSFVCIVTVFSVVQFFRRIVSMEPNAISKVLENRGQKSLYLGCVIAFFIFFNQNIIFLQSLQNNYANAGDPINIQAANQNLLFHFVTNILIYTAVFYVILVVIDWIRRKVKKESPELVGAAQGSTSK